MPIADRWQEIERSLPADWSAARLLLTLADEPQAERSAALLAPINPGRKDQEVRFYASPSNSGAIRRLLRRLDTEEIGGTLELVESETAEPTAPPAQAAEETLASTWDELLGSLPADWSDSYGEIELTSTDFLERAALLLAPLNPSRSEEAAAFRFRCARSFGYGAAPQMVRRCLERLDAEEIRGWVRILWVVSDSDPVATQGPVWYVGGRPV